MTVLCYDPARIGDLERRATAAAADLVALSSDDPAAIAPLHAVRQARAHLEREWLPLLRRLAASEALLTWSSSGPPVDPALVDAVFTRLGGGGTAELLIDLGSQRDDPDDALAAATAIRDRLVASSRRSGLPPGFAREFVEECVRNLDRADRNAGVALSFLFGGRSLGTAFLVEATRAIVEHEVVAGGDEPEYGGSLWGSTSGIGAPISVLIDPLDREPGDSPDLRPGGDPMMAVLDAMAGDADAGRQVFTDEPVARYLLGERDYWMDGMRRLAEAAAAAAEGEPLVASAFVNHVGSRRESEMLAMYDNDAVGAAAAVILGQHIVSVQHAVLVAEDLDVAAGKVVPIVDEVTGGRTVTGAMFDETALHLVTSLAVGSVDGMATIRAAVDVHQQGRAAAGVRRIADGDVADTDRFLREALADAARLEAYVVEHVGHRAEAMGRSRDDAVTFWAGTVSNVADMADVTGLDIVLDPAIEGLQDEFADHEAAAATDAEAMADIAANRLTYAWYAELYRQGLVVPDLPADAVHDGQLVGWDQFQHLDAADRQTVRHLMEETTGRGGVNINANALRDVVKTQQLDIYQELD